MQFSLLVAEQRRIKKIDINPLLVSTTQILAMDARIVLHDPGSVTKSSLAWRFAHIRSSMSVRGN